MSASLADVTEAMKDVIDPELGINIVTGKQIGRAHV